jgi:hypothetical protein
MNPSKDKAFGFAISVVLLSVSLLCADESLDEIFELKAFVVYEGLIEVVDGITGELYHESNPTVEGFREEFNHILLAYHKHLLKTELFALREHIERDKLFVAALRELALTFGIKGFSIHEKHLLSRDKSMLSRLARDPFFRIKRLVVWDLDKLALLKGEKPSSAYAVDIRYNQELERWERRITTEWRVNYTASSTRGGYRAVNVTKYQGLNLDSKKGYHFCAPGIPADVPPYAFKDVILDYPIFINSKESPLVQVERLKNDFIINLTHIYDPFSWTVRSNVRYRGTFFSQLLPHVKAEKFPFSDRDWFEEVITRLLCDITSMKLFGARETYDFAMLNKIPVNKNRLGEGLDLLNWNTGENRRVSYDPSQQYPVQINFDSARHARFILVDAYRRYEVRFTDLLLERIRAAQKNTSAKELLKEVLAEVSGIPADAYIHAASKAQIAELEKHRHKLE